MKEFMEDMRCIYGVQMLTISPTFIRFCTEPIQGMEKFTDIDGWKEDVYYNFEHFCQAQFKTKLGMLIKIEHTST